MDLEEIGAVGGTDWNDLTQGMNTCRAVVNTVMNLQFP